MPASAAPVSSPRPRRPQARASRTAAVRTVSPTAFQAAAYLRKMGADTVEVKRMFATSMSAYQERCKVVAAAQIYRHCAICGVKEKILAAKRAGITELILSEENRKDIAEIKPEYIAGLTFHYVKTNEEV